MRPSQTLPGTDRMSDLAAVGVQHAGVDARLVAGDQHDRAGAVAEQHAGAAVVPVEDAREHFGADHQRVLCHVVFR